MNQASIRINKIIIFRGTIFWSMFAFLIMVSLLYVYLVDKTVWNVVARQQDEKQLSNLSSNIDNLEFQYIALKNTITPDLATSMGYTESQNTTFITRNDAPASLSYNRN